MIMHSNNTKIFLHTACISLFVSETPSVKNIYIFPLGMVLPLKKKNRCFKKSSWNQKIVRSGKKSPGISKKKSPEVNMHWSIHYLLHNCV